MIIDKKVAEEDEVVLKRETGKTLIKEIIVYYTGSQTDYENTIYYPNGLIDDEEGVEAILVLFDKGGWSINFSKEGFEYNLTNVLNILQKNTFKAVASNEIELEDTTGYSGELHLNGEIVSSEGDGGLLIKNATEIIDNDWEKIGEREPYECVVESTSSPEVKIIFEINNVYSITGMTLEEEMSEQTEIDLPQNELVNVVGGKITDTTTPGLINSLALDLTNNLFAPISFSMYFPNFYYLLHFLRHLYKVYMQYIKEEFHQLTLIH